MLVHVLVLFGVLGGCHGFGETWTSTHTRSQGCSFVYGTYTNSLPASANSQCTIGHDNVGAFPPAIASRDVTKFYLHSQDSGDLEFREKAVQFNLSQPSITTDCWEARSATFELFMEGNDSGGGTIGHVDTYGLFKIRSNWTISDFEGHPYPTGGTAIEHWDDFHGGDPASTPAIYDGVTFTVSSEQHMGSLQLTSRRSGTAHQWVFNANGLEFLTATADAMRSDPSASSFGFVVAGYGVTHQYGDPGSNAEIQFQQPIADGTSSKREMDFTWDASTVILEVVWANDTDACGVCHGDGSSCANQPPTEVLVPCTNYTTTLAMGTSSNTTTTTAQDTVAEKFRSNLGVRHIIANRSDRPVSRIIVTDDRRAELQGPPRRLPLVMAGPRSDSVGTSLIW